MCDCYRVASRDVSCSRLVGGNLWCMCLWSTRYWVSGGSVMREIGKQADPLHEPRNVLHGERFQTGPASKHFMQVQKKPCTEQRRTSSGRVGNAIVAAQSSGRGNTNS